MILSILIPVFNEENTILEILKKINEINLDRFGLEKEIIIVNDGSTDRTKKILEELKTRNNFALFHHRKNQGKGAAIKTGLEHAAGDFILIQDADLEYDPADYPVLLEPLIENEINIVYGSRGLKKNPSSSIGFYLGGKFLTFILNLLFGTKLTDINTCYKVFKREVLRDIKLEESGFAFCEEVTAKVIKKGYKIKEIPISYNPRDFKEGKKIRFYDGIIGLWTIIKYRIL